MRGDVGERLPSGCGSGQLGGKREGGGGGLKKGERIPSVEGRSPFEIPDHSPHPLAAAPHSFDPKCIMPPNGAASLECARACSSDWGSGALPMPKTSCLPNWPALADALCATPASAKAAPPTCERSSRRLPACMVTPVVLVDTPAMEVGGVNDCTAMAASMILRRRQRRRRSG